MFYQHATFFTFFNRTGWSGGGYTSLEDKDWLFTAYRKENGYMLISNSYGGTDANAGNTSVNGSTGSGDPLTDMSMKPCLYTGECKYFFNTI